MTEVDDTPHAAGPVDMAAADQLLRDCGYTRLNDWTTRDAQIRIEDIR